MNERHEQVKAPHGEATEKREWVEPTVERHDVRDEVRGVGPGSADAIIDGS